MSTKSQDSRQICSKYVFFKVKRGTINKKKKIVPPQIRYLWSKLN